MSGISVQPEKPKYPRAEALEVAREMVGALRVWTRRIIVAGSLRRRKEMVGDVEILFIPKLIEVKEERQGELMACDEPKPKMIDLAGRILGLLTHASVISPRASVRGAFTWGDKNKLARHVA